MSPWWLLVASVLTGGTIVVARRVARVLGDVASLLHPDHGLAASSASLARMADEAALVQERLADVGAVVAGRRRLLRMAHPGRPWVQLRQRALPQRERHGSDRSSP